MSENYRVFRSTAGPQVTKLTVQTIPCTHTVLLHYASGLPWSKHMADHLTLYEQGKGMLQTAELQFTVSKSLFCYANEDCAHFCDPSPCEVD